MEIYFKRKNSLHEVLIENWVFSMISDKGEYNQNSSNDLAKKLLTSKNNYNELTNNKKDLLFKKYRKVSAVKKLSTLLRTVYTYTRFLPAFDLGQRLSFDYNLECKCYFLPSGDQNISNCSNLKRRIKHKVDVNIGLIAYSVSFLDKSDIFLMEQSIVKIFNIRKHKLSGFPIIDSFQRSW